MTPPQQVAIHQPNFFPWLGYFDKIVRSDAFVFLDDAQYQKTGGSWSNRVKMLQGGEARWYSAPIRRDFHGVKPVNALLFNHTVNWRGALLRKLAQEYRHAPYYTTAMAFIEPLLLHDESSVAAYNIHAVRRIATALGVPQSRFYLASQLGSEGTSNARLVSLTQRLGATAYICGGGADSYQDEALFTAAGIRLVRQNFVPQPYPQHAALQFVAGLSIVDALMQIGFDGVRRLLNCTMEAA